VTSDTDRIHRLGSGGRSVAGVLLAAGTSSRMQGPNKLLIPVEGTAVVARICSTALKTELNPFIVVLGHERGEVRGALESLRDAHPSRLYFVINPDYREGRLSSVKAAVRALPGECTAAMFLRGDQPWITAGLICAIIREFRKKGASLAFPTYKGRKGSPTLFARAHFQRLLSLRGDRGTLEMVNELWDDAAKLEVDDPHCLMGVDTPEDLEKLSQ
jgi:molybdenum cofactor cytidylyltransferase